MKFRIIGLLLIVFFSNVFGTSLTGKQLFDSCITEDEFNQIKDSNEKIVSAIKIAACSGYIQGYLAGSRYLNGDAKLLQLEKEVNSAKVVISTTDYPLLPTEQFIILFKKWYKNKINSIKDNNKKAEFDNQNIGDIMDKFVYEQGWIKTKFLKFCSTKNS